MRVIQDDAISNVSGGVGAMNSTRGTPSLMSTKVIEGLSKNIEN